MANNQVSDLKSSSLTVIIATMNSATNAPFRDCIASIQKQRTDIDVQILVADGGSTDETLRVAQLSGAQIVNNPAITELGFSGGKNLALQKVRSEFVTMVDADNVLIENDYVDNMVRPLVEDPRIDVTVPTPYIPERGSAPPITRYFCRLEQDYWHALSKRGLRRGSWIKFYPPSTPIPNAGIMRASLLKGLGGWDYDTEVGARMIANGHGCFALVMNAHRFHVEMLNYRDVVRKFSRRMNHHFHNHSQKPEVTGQLRSAIRRPIQAIAKELIEPLSRMVYVGDLAYIQAIPVFIIKTALLIRLWPSTLSTLESRN